MPQASTSRAAHTRIAHTRTTLLRSAAVASASAALCLAFPTAASAHVHASPDTATIGGYTDLAFGVPHGCDGSSTTKVEFTIPAEFESVTPNVNPNWTIKKVTDGDGEGAAVKKVTYTAKTPLPADMKDTLTLSVKIADDAKPGTALVPTMQTCETGSVDWSSASHDDKYPAPTVELLADDATGAEHADHNHSDHSTHDHSSHNHNEMNEKADATTSENTEVEQAASASETKGNYLGAWGLGLGAVGALTGIAALLAALKKRD